MYMIEWCKRKQPEVCHFIPKNLWVNLHNVNNPECTRGMGPGIDQSKHELATCSPHTFQMINSQSCVPDQLNISPVKIYSILSHICMQLRDQTHQGETKGKMTNMFKNLCWDTQQSHPRINSQTPSLWKLFGTK